VFSCQIQAIPDDSSGSCKYVCNTIRHRSVKNHRSKSGLYKLNVSDGSPAFERYLKLRKIFITPNLRTPSNDFSFDAVTTWKPWDNDGHTEKGAFVSLAVVSRHRFVAVLLD